MERIIHISTSSMPNRPITVGENSTSNGHMHVGPNLEDYNWYEYTFLTYLLKREDYRQPYWKEKFISGLPSLFSQRIFNKLSEIIGRSPIPFEQITFDQLLSFIKKEGISLCNELKLQARYSTDNAAKQKELGSFCKEFYLPKLDAPSVKK